MIRAVLFLVVAMIIWYLVRAAMSHNRYVSSREKQEIDDRTPDPDRPEAPRRNGAVNEEARDARFRDL